MGRIIRRFAVNRILVLSIFFLSYCAAAYAQIGPGSQCTSSVPCFVTVTGGGGGSSTANQGTQAASADGSTWFVQQYLGGSAVGLTNPVPVTPGTGSTFPVSGTVAATQSGTWNIGSVTTLPSITVSSSALPTGAATSANQTNGSQLSGVLGTDGATISSLANPFPVVITGMVGAGQTPNQVSATCSTSSSTILAANSALQSESFHLAATAANPVWLNFAGATAVQAAPSFDLQPGQTITWNVTGALLPVSAITCIASASTAVTEIYK